MRHYERVHLDTLTLVGFEHIGKVAASSQAWPKLNDYLVLERLATPEGKCVGIQHTDSTPEECHYDMGFSIDPARAEQGELGKTFHHELYPFFKVFEMAGGWFIRTTHTGAYRGISASYRALCASLEEKGVDFVPLPYVQIYRNHPTFVAERELVTDLYIRLSDGG